MMNKANTLAQSQITVMVSPSVEAELQRMAQEARQAFYANDDTAYLCHEVQANLAQHFGLDTGMEYRYYLWMRRHVDSKTGLPFAALYVVTAYGTIVAEKCTYSNNSIASLMRTFGCRANELRGCSI